MPRRSLIAASGTQTRPFAIVPAALIAAAAVLLFWVEIEWVGYIALAAGLSLAVVSDRIGASAGLAKDLLLIAVALAAVSLISLEADISPMGMVRFTLALGAAVVIPYSLSRWVFKDHFITFPLRLERWTGPQWLYLVGVIIAAYLILPFYFISSGVWQNWPTVLEWHEIARLFVGVNAVGIWDELFFICTCYVLFMRHFRPWLANVLQAAIFVSFLWELGYREWGPLLTIPFALVQGLVFTITRRNLLYVVVLHLLFDAVVFLVIVHAHHPDALPIFPLMHGF